MSNNATEKICTKCGKTKPITEFNLNTRSGNYLNDCSECHKKYHQAYYRKLKTRNANKTVEVDPNKSKICIKCKTSRPLTDFAIDKANAKITNICKACKALSAKEHYIKNKEEKLAYAKEYRDIHKEKLSKYFAEYRIEHAEERREYSRQYNKDHQDKLKLKRKIYRQEHQNEFRERDKEYARTHKEQISKRYKEWAKINAERLAEYSKQYRERNAERLKAKAQEYGKIHRKEITKYYLNKRDSDPLFKLSTQIRGLIRVSLKNRGYGKSTHTYEVLGCDYETLWAHLKQTWLDNYGTEWSGEDYHIDHIIPLATAKSEQEVLDLCYYKNLQMLKPKDNLQKNKFLDWKLTTDKE